VSDAVDRKRRRASAAIFSVTMLAIVISPLLWRVVLATWGPKSSDLKPSNLPALESARDRYPFDPAPIDELRATRPGTVILGDSMALRIEPDVLARLTGRPVMPLIRLATGAAHWYLLLKNYVVASGVTPDRVVVFFRDTQLTDPLWRLIGRDRFSTDRYALDREDDLNAVVAAHVQNPWYRLHSWIDRTYEVEQTRDWIEPAMTASIARAVAPDQSHDDFVGAMNGMFGLDRLRAFEAADMGEADEAALDFASRLPISTLPLMLDLARAHGLHLTFVRVLRRPTNGQPPHETPRLRRYVLDLRAYLETRGSTLLDDRDVPALWHLAYDDGDHILDPERPRYTEIFVERVTGRP
jgi:hypothetical protein